MIGKVLNKRYKLEGTLGEGGMALVYKAKDLILDRWVAIKILRPQLMSDKEFLNRFHREAKAVARLSHPNVVNIYDIGQDGDIYYLVMEILHGEDLKTKIKKTGGLSPEEALKIAIEICEALVVAHKNNIVHCDIKPHNIIITPENGVKVTDFGIARAMNSATLAHTETVIGTAHYFSPEQARGGTITASSDLYSLGVVLYEMLTGQVPFRGDSPISVALKHINEEILPPSQLNDKLPKRIDKLIMKSVAKEPANRFANASEMLAALKSLARTFPKYQDDDIQHTYFDEDETQVLPKIRDHQLTKPESQENIRSRSHQKKKSVYSRIIKIFLVIILLLGAFAAFSLWALNQYTKVPITEVPDFVGLSEQDAKGLAREKGLRLTISDIEISSPDIPEGHVVTQDIEAGKEVKRNRVVTLTLSKGATMTVVPDLIGKDMRQIEIALHEADLVVGEVKYQFTSKIPKDQLITQNPPANKQAKSGSTVDLVLSKGPEPISGTIPNLIGLTREEAERRITETNFTIGNIIEVETTRYLQGYVADQNPPAGTQIMEGTVINLTVSSGLFNPKGLEIQSLQVSIHVSERTYNQQIQIVVTDDNGREIVYEQVHHPDDYISKVVYTVGPAIIQVYNNGELIREERLGI